MLKAIGSLAGAAGVVGATTGASADTQARPKAVVPPGGLVDEFEPAHPSNLERADRGPTDVRWIVLHTLDAPFDQSVEWFTIPQANASSHYVVDDHGYVVGMVSPDDVSFTNGNGGYNATSINVEIAGWADATPFSDAVYRRVATLVDALCAAYDIPRRHPTDDIGPCTATGGLGGIVGHNQIPAPGDCNRVVAGKRDPGATWDWSLFVDLLGDPPGAFAEDESVLTTDVATVREVPEVGDNVVFAQPTDVPGTVTGAPVESDGFRWWNVAYENGIEGWSPERVLSATAFGTDRRVVTREVANVREHPRVGDNVVFTQPTARLGTVADGPTTADGITWWKIAYDDGITGWTAESALGRPAFHRDDRVATTTTVSVRDGPGSGYGRVTVASDGTSGYVRGGPVEAGTFTWWRIAYNAGYDGWTAGRYLRPAPIL